MSNVAVSQALRSGSGDALRCAFGRTHAYSR